LLSSLDISETAINTFIRQLLPAHKNERGFKYKAGLFLSAVIQASKDQKITVDVTGLPALNKLCCFLEKKELTIKGDVGDSTAAYAKSGSIIIKGNAGDGTGGDLNGASVIVEGNAKYYTASGAKSGSVTVKGNTGYGTGASLNGASVIVKGAAGNETASGARSGVIHVGGKSGLGENIGENVKIFEAGQQIWPKTK
jgi:formylmethanofuran dehydrogenase subunit C